MYKIQKYYNPLVTCLHDRSISLGISLEVAERATLPTSNYCVTTKNGTHYHRMGDLKSSKKIVFLHAMGGNLHNWLPVASELGNDCDQYYVDLPWHGSTNKNTLDNDSYENYYIDWLGDFIDSSGLKDVSFAGHSLGGRVAAVYALARPEFVHSLILINPALSPSFKGLVALESAVLKLLSSSRFTTVDRAVIKLFLSEMLVSKSLHTLTSLEYAIEEVLRDQAPIKMVGILHALEWFQESKFDYESLGLLANKIKITVLLGQKDIYCPNKEIWELGTSNISIEVIKRSGHLLPLEHPLICANRIKSSLAG